jgi:hypothetical protein
MHTQINGRICQELNFIGHELIKQKESLTPEVIESIFRNCLKQEGEVNNIANINTNWSQPPISNREEVHKTTLLSLLTLAKKCSNKHLYLISRIEAQYDLELAKASASSCDRFYKYYAFVEIVKIVAYRNLEEAIKIAKTLPDHPGMYAWQKIVKIVAHQNLAEAKKIAETLPDESAEKAWGEINKIEVQIDPEAVKRRAYALRNFEKRAYALFDIIKKEALFAPEAAKITATTIPCLTYQSLAFKAIVEIQAKNGDFEAAKSTAEEEITLRGIAFTDLENEKILTMQYRDEALLLTVKYEAQKSIVEARKTAETIKDGGKQVEAFCEIAKIEAQQGENINILSPQEIEIFLLHPSYKAAMILAEFDINSAKLMAQRILEDAAQINASIALAKREITSNPESAMQTLQTIKEKIIQTESIEDNSKAIFLARILPLEAQLDFDFAMMTAQKTEALVGSFLKENLAEEAIEQISDPGQAIQMLEILLPTQSDGKSATNKDVLEVKIETRRSLFKALQKTFDIKHETQRSLAFVEIAKAILAFNHKH